MDTIEASLVEISDKLRIAWEGNTCLVCPLAELAALAAAVLQLYRESRHTTNAQVTPYEYEHWTNYRRSP